MTTQHEVDAVTMQFEEIAERFTLQMRNNESPDIEDYVEQYPDLEDVIRRLLPVLELMESNGSLAEDLSQLGSLVSSLGGDAGKRSLEYPSPVGEQIGDFSILQEIGRGGMGVVYMARQRSLARNVALKLLFGSSQFDDRRRKRFQQEARASAMLHHTNIVPIFDIGQHESMPYLVMQYIESSPLDEVLTAAGASPLVTDSKASTQKLLAASTDDLTRVDNLTRVDGGHEKIPEPRALSRPNLKDHAQLFVGPDRYQYVAVMGAKIAEALAHAHSKGILHRDVKPSNLLLNDEGEVWITDFGLAKTLDSPDLTQTGEVVGTLRYMSPEQLNGRPDERSDVFGLGLTLYETATLKTAYDAEERDELVKQIIAAEPKRISRANSNVPRDLATIIEKAVATRPQDRYQTAAQLADDLRRFVAGEPIHARRISSLERTIKWCRRRPLIATLVSGLFLSLVAGIAGTTYHARQTSSALADLKVQSEKTEEALAELQRQSQITKDALAESKKQSGLALDTLSSVIDDFSRVLQNPTTSTAEYAARKRMTERVLKGLQFVSEAMKSRNDYGKTMIWSHIDLGDLMLTMGGEGFVNAEEEALVHFKLAYEKSKMWLKNKPDSRAAKEVASESIQKLAKFKFFQSEFTEAVELIKESVAITEALSATNEYDYDKVINELEKHDFKEEQIFQFVNNAWSQDQDIVFKDEVEKKTSLKRGEIQDLRRDALDRRRLIRQTYMTGLYYFRQFDLPNAILWFERAQAKVAETSKRNPASIDSFISSWMTPTLKDMLIITKNLPTVREDPEFAMQFGEKAPRLLYDAAAWLAFEGNYLRAEEILKRIEKIEDLSDTDHYSNACGYTRCIKAMMDGRDLDELSDEEEETRRRYMNRSLRCLEQAIDNGFGGASRVGLIGRDHDLDPLRGWEPFEAFFKKLADKTNGQ